MKTSFQYLSLLIMLACTALAIALSPTNSYAYNNPERKKCIDEFPIDIYPGSDAQDCKMSEYDEAIIPLGPQLKQEANFSKQEAFEGKVYYAALRAPKNRSALEVMRNFQQAALSQGFRIVFECGGSGSPKCADRNYGKVQVWRDSPTLYLQNDRGFTATLDRPGSPKTHVVLFIRNETGSNYLLFYLQEKGMDQGMVTMSPLASTMAQQGYVTLHINFDTGASTIRPESYSEIEQLLALMNEYPAMRVRLEGHTDNVGSAESNRTLSFQRAESVKNALSERGVAQYRMETAGFGPDRPIASNDTNEGKAQNRRVEIINLTPEALTPTTQSTTGTTTTQSSSYEQTTSQTANQSYNTTTSSHDEDEEQQSSGSSKIENAAEDAAADAIKDSIRKGMWDILH